VLRYEKYVLQLHIYATGGHIAKQLHTVNSLALLWYPSVRALFLLLESDSSWRICITSAKLKRAMSQLLQFLMNGASNLIGAVYE
jgi:hypothetical protein